MSCRNDAGCNSSLHQRREPKQTQGIGDLRTRPSDPLGQFLLGTTEIFKQLTIGSCFFQRVQLGAMQVLQQRISQKVRIIHIPNNRRNSGKAGIFSSTQPSLTHDELIAPSFVRLLSNHNRLKDTDLTNAVNKFSEHVLVEHRTRLTRVGLNALNIDFAEFSVRNRIDALEPPVTLIGLADRRINGIDYFRSIRVDVLFFCFFAIRVIGTGRIDTRMCLIHSVGAVLPSSRILVRTVAVKVSLRRLCLRLRLRNLYGCRYALRAIR